MMATKRLSPITRQSTQPTAAAPPTQPTALAPGQVADVPALTDEQILTLPCIHLLLYGDSGSGKSTFAATFMRIAQAYWTVMQQAKPMLIMAFDPWDKMMPYKRMGKSLPVQDANWADYYRQIGIEAEDVVSENGIHLARIEYYVDADPKQPNAMNALEQRTVGFEQDAPNWSTVVIDSVTFLQYASLNRAKFKKPGDLFQPGFDMRQWYAIMKVDIEQTLKSKMVWWKTNTIAVFHTSEEKEEFADSLLRGILTVGKLQKELPPGFGEMYRVKLVADPGRRGEFQRQLQTRHDGLWAATSVVAQAPNPCRPMYEALWANYLMGK